MHPLSRGKLRGPLNDSWMIPVQCAIFGEKQPDDGEHSLVLSEGGHAL